jgi:EmrB/QacA subfamily drug resistance transporter
MPQLIWFGADDMESNNIDEGSKHLALFSKEVLVVASVALLTNFLTGYNTRLAAVGMPTIAHDLKADIWSLVWIIQGFMLGSITIQLIVGRLADLFGRIKLLKFGLALFTLGALASGLSINPYILVTSRFLQGLGGGFLISLTVTILADSAPPSMYGRLLGFTQVAFRAGAAVGLTLSGFIIDYFGWRWIFLLQVPIGLVIIWWGSRKLRERYKAVEKREIDFMGFALFTTSITSLLITLTFTGYGFESLSRLLLGISLLLLALFVFWELKRSSPALDLRIFKVWQFTGGVLAQLMYSIGFGAFLTLLSIYLQVIKGFSASITGLLLVPFEVLYLVSGVLGGWLSDAIGFAPVTIAGLAIASTGLCMSSRAQSMGMLMLSETIFGVGAGLFVPPNTSSIMVSVPPYRRGVASSIRTLSFNIGFLLSLNIAVLTMTSYIPYDIVSQLITLGEATSMTQITIANLNSLDKAIRQAFSVQAVIMALGIPFSLSRIKRK